MSGPTSHIDRFEHHCNSLREFIVVHERLPRQSCKNIDERRLAKWVSSQRSAQDRGKLSDERAAVINNINNGILASFRSHLEKKCTREVVQVQVHPRENKDKEPSASAIGQLAFKKEARNNMSTSLQATSIEAKAATAAIASGKRLLSDDGRGGAATTPKPSKSKRSRKQDDNNESNANDQFTWSNANDPFTWTHNLYQLILFQSRNNGSSIVPDDDDDCLVAEWVRNERILYKKYIKGEVVGMSDQQKKLQDEHISALKQIGFVFEACTKRTITPERHQIWQSWYDKLIQYKHDNDGDCNPKQRSKLGQWVNKQRMANREYTTLLQQFTQKYPNHPPLLPEEMPRRNKIKDAKEAGVYHLITQERIDKLNSLEGFQWDCQKWTPFEQRLEEYKQFQIKEGHGFIPIHYQHNPALGKWVSKIRYDYTLFKREQQQQQQQQIDGNTMGEGTKRARSQLTAERIQQLKEVGFEFSIKNRQQE